MRTLSSPHSYDKTFVLLLGWTAENDDTDTTGELRSLKRVLQETYGFYVESKRIHLQKHPQVQATRYLAEFICREDFPGRLLIVYYAGHGADYNGRLLLAGQLAQCGDGVDINIDWVDLEVILGKTEADVLVVFDCCCAGVLCRPAIGGGLRRKFQYVAACKWGQLTPTAGPKSFTSAMIWALNGMAHEPGFTVRRLVRRLMEHEHFPSGEQEAVVFASRFGRVDGDIWLAPARKRASATGPRQASPTVDVLDLRFHFAEHATEEDIEQTAQTLKSLLKDEESIRFQSISFLNHASYAGRAGRRWIEVIQQDRKQREADAMTELIASSKTGRAGGENKSENLAALRSVLERLGRPVPAWHATSYMVA